MRYIFKLRGGFLVGTLFLVVMYLGGCATIGGVRDSKGQGVAHVFDADYDRVWAATTQAVKSVGLWVNSVNKSDGCVLAQRTPTGWSWGEKVAVYVEKIDEKRTRVEVISRRVVTVNITATDWEKPILDRIGEILKEGR